MIKLTGIVARRKTAQVGTQNSLASCGENGLLSKVCTHPKPC